MKLKAALLALFLSAQALGAHVNDRAIYATDIKAANGTSVFRFPTILPNQSTAAAFNDDGEITSSTKVSLTELEYLDGVTSPLQAQLDSKAVFPSQTGQSGKFLSTNGLTTSWQSVNSAVWGNITGTLSNQTDLQTALDAKQAGPLTGDVTTSGAAATIANDSVTNAKLANVATATFKGRTTSGTGDPEDLTATQATALLNNFVGDSGSGGTKGLVPAPASGDAAALKFLKANGNWTQALFSDLGGTVSLAQGGEGASNAETVITTTGTITALTPATLNLTHNNGSLTSIQGITAATAGTLLRYRAGASSVGVTLVNQSSGASAANRLSIGSDIFVRAGTSVLLKYSGSESRWVFADLDFAVRSNNAASTANLYTTLANGGGVLLGTNSVVWGNEAMSAGTCTLNQSYVGGYRALRNCAASVGSLSVIGANTFTNASYDGENASSIGAGVGANATTADNIANVGANSFTALTTGDGNANLGAGGCTSVSTGSNNTCLNSAGVNFGTGSSNVALGAASGSNVANVSNCSAMTPNSRCTGSSQFRIGSSSTSYSVSINDAALNRTFNVAGTIDATGYYLNNVLLDFTGYWDKDGNAFGADGILGTTDAYNLLFKTNNAEVARFTTSGILGVQQSSPDAVVHAGSKTGTIDPPSSISVGINLASSGGFTFGSGNRDYSARSIGTISGTTVFSSAVSTTFNEPSISDYNPSGGSAADQPGSGFDPNVDPLPSYSVTSLFSGDTLESTGGTSFSLSSWTDTDPKDVLVSWSGSAAGGESNFFVVRNGSEYRFVGSTSFVDDNTGWTSGTSSGASAISNYTIGISIGSSNYRVYETTNGKFIDGTGGSETDDGSWASGTTASPTSAPYNSLETDADALLGGHVYTQGTAPSVSSCGTSPSVVGNDNVGRITVGTGGVATSCTLTFASSWKNAPICVVTNESTSLLLRPAPTTTALVITAGSAFGASDKIGYHCFGYQ